jgi:predicted nucleotidyltransferase
MTMSPVVRDKLDELIALCRKFHVAKLELFGSAAGDDGFDPAKSDLDFLVEFQPLEPEDHADSYMDLLSDLKRLFGRRVDLVETRAVDNPYFLQSINRARRVLYAA